MGTIKRVYAVCGVICAIAMAALLLPGRIVDFENKLPGAFRYVSSILYSSKAWTGTFDKYPEGLADMASLGISTDVDAALELEVYGRNRLDGRIWWQGSCALGSPYSGLLVDGRIRLGGSSAKVVIWELIGGHRINLGQGLLEIDGIMITFSGFPESLGLNESKIAKNPEPVQLEDWPDLYCDWFEDWLEIGR
ncbi:hypothetical protein [Roseovarius indicus]|uniref:hypothetical protein n=1 Tax=Roseovarius indicus TaxID=540747 RepID=UPI0007D9E81B|nr:hypothetical protein [Roseovarius indicus]OAO05916.1 hypothetical protein A8B76_11985 [Roseovarius indicus]